MKKRNIFLLASVCVLSMGLCACAKEDASGSDMVSTQATVSEEESVEESVTVKSEYLEAIKAVEEAETVEAVIPEGIDLESDLSGEEWLKSFEGNVKEPVVVVFSDITGRKEVIQQNATITINPDEDMIGVYLYNKGAARINGFATEGGVRGKHYDISGLDSEITRSVGKIPVEITIVGGDDGDVVFNFIIIAD